MPWRQISFDVDDDIKDAVIGELNAFAPLGIWENETGTAATRILAFFQPDVDLRPFRTALHALCSASRRPLPEIAFEILEDRDWNEEWKRSYRSFPLGERFFIVPSWHAPDCPPNRRAIFIDPGQAFGTGTHETTQLTLEALERFLRPQHAVLDFGTGSGILAIAAAMLGARQVVACDNDPVATAIAKENAERNQSNVDIFCGSTDSLQANCVDVLLCNVTADVIAEGFRELDRIIRTGGIAIFSGILNTQQAMILDVLRQFQYDVVEGGARGEWVVIVGVKHGR